MKNLKRVLSLALASVMVIGMMAVGASATDVSDFSDGEKITHEDAVTTMASLGVIEGYPDNTYLPEKEVTRAEMAAIITRILNGGVEPTLGTATSPMFTDVTGWARPYVEYCANLKIVDGMGDGTFHPNDTVTGAQAAKMLLGAAGYKSDVFHFTGAEWELNVNRIANQKGLYAETKLASTSVGLSRDNAAQMAYNTLATGTITTEWQQDMTTGKITEGYKETGITVLTKYFGAQRVEGVVTKNEFSDNTNSVGKTTLTITNRAELGDTYFTGDQIFPVSTGEAEFGRSVILFVKPSASAPAAASKAVVVGDAVLNNNVEYTTTSLAGTSFAKFIDGKGLELEATPAYYVNYKVAAPFTNLTKGDSLTVIDTDGDGKIETVLKNTYAFGQVTKYITTGDGAVSVKTTGDSDLAPSNAKLKVVKAYDGIAVDDYVNMTLVDKTYYVTKADKVEGAISAIVAGKSFTIDGTTYTLSGEIVLEGMDDPATYAADSGLKKEVTVYLDKAGYAVAGDSKVSKAYAFVTSASWDDTAVALNNGTLIVYAVFEDGTQSGSLKVSKYNDRAITTDIHARVIGKLFTYTKNSDGTINLTDVEGEGHSANGNAVSFEKGKVSMKVDTLTYYVTKDTVVYVATQNKNDTDKLSKVSVYNGTTAPSVTITGADNNGIYNSGYKAGVLYVVNADEPTQLDAVVFADIKTAVTGNWLYLDSYVNTTNDGAVYWAVVNGEVKKVTLTDKTTTYAGAYEYELSGEKYAIGDPVNTVTGNIVQIGSNSVVLAGDEYTVNSDTVIATPDGEDTTIGDKYFTKDTVAVVYETINGKGTAVGVFILESYSDTNHSLFGAKAGYSDKVYENSADTEKAAWVIKNGTAWNDALLVSEGASIYVYTVGSDAALATQTGVANRSGNVAGTTWSGLTAGSATASNGYYEVYVVAETHHTDARSGEYGRYTFKCEP